MPAYPSSLAKLIELLQALPGLGPRSAQRVAFFLLNSPERTSKELAEAILAVKGSISTCPQCFNYSEGDLCPICSDGGRERGTICVVATPTDLLALERTGKYRGMYHVLEGLISPLDGRGPESIRARELLERVRSGEVQEVIMALSHGVEGDATALYLTPLLREKGAKVTRLARGLPAGADLDYADETTVVMALEGRREMASPR